MAIVQKYNYIYNNVYTPTTLRDMLHIYCLVIHHISRSEIIFYAYLWQICDVELFGPKFLNVKNMRIFAQKTIYIREA